MFVFVLFCCFCDSNLEQIFEIHLGTTWFLDPDKQSLVFTVQWLLFIIGKNDTIPGSLKLKWHMVLGLLQ